MSIASITFTYRKNERNGIIYDREPLFYYRSYDKHYNDFKNKLDYNLYIFHNCDKTYSKNIINKYLNKNSNNYYYILRDTYPKCFEFVLHYLKSIGIKKIVFFQDDVYSYNKSWKYFSDKAIEAYNDLYFFLRNTNIPYINLEQTVPTNKFLLIYESKYFNFYQTNTSFFRDIAGLWSFNDSSYFADLNFLLDKVYDQKYFNSPNIYEAEFVLKNKFDHQDLEKVMSNNSFFQRFLLIGPNAQNKYIEFYKTKIKQLIQNDT
jgi:hypothetical protein